MPEKLNEGLLVAAMILSMYLLYHTWFPIIHVPLDKGDSPVWHP